MKICRTPFAQRGVSLIELMIGMLIGLLAVLIISQVLLVSEGQKRTTTSGSDAQVAGALALYAMQRDVQTAGYGFSSMADAIGCTVNHQFNGAALANFPNKLLPVQITAKTGGMLSDRVRILASSKTSYTVPTLLATDFAVNGQSFTVNSTMGFANGDLGLVAVDATQPCWVFQVTSAPGAQSLQRIDQPTKWNSAGSPNQAYPTGSIIANLGSLVDNTYEVVLVNNVPTLRLTSFDLANPDTPVVRNIQSDIVAMRAFYGLDTNALSSDGTIDKYETPDAATQNAMTSAQWQKVLSVRLLVVARSGQYEHDQVTRANPSWDVGTNPPTTGAATTTSCPTSECVTFTEVGVDSVNDVEANHYRYKVFEIIVPVRNMVWKESTT